MGESIIRDLESQGLQLNKEKQSYVGKDGCIFLMQSQIINHILSILNSLNCFDLFSCLMKTKL